jgi:hypothetical protein
MEASPTRAVGTTRTVLSDLATWVLRHPLALCLPVQAALLFADLGRLPVWGDEQTSLARAVLPLRELIHELQSNVHPTLYFLLLRAWLALPWPFDGIVAARAFSALTLIVATVALDRCWLARCDARTRAWMLALWSVSPALLLYGRMARSYSLQLLLATLALAAGARYAARPSLPRLVAYAAAAVALLWTHYLPASAVVASVTLVMLMRSVLARDVRAVLFALAPLPVIAIGFAGWISTFAGALGRVGAAAPYHVLGSAWLDSAAALAFTFISFTIGESVSLCMIAALALLTAPIAMLLAQGLRARPAWLAFVIPTAVIAFLGAQRWVSYAFVAGRLLFLLPFYLLLLVGGGNTRPRLRAAVCVALLVLSLGGISAYWGRTGFLNKAYVIPVGEIADRIAAAPGSADSLIIIDHHSCNLSLAAPDLNARTIQLADQATFDDVIRRTSNHDGPVWFVRATHDVSRAGWNRRVEAALAPRFSIERSAYAPYSDFDRWLMQLAGWPERPTHAVEVLELRRRGAPE